jgi:hypothetical protein
MDVSRPEVRSPDTTGTTIRLYDPERRVWRSVWITPEHGDVDLFLGRRVGDEIVLEMQAESKEEGDGDIRWVFYDVTPDSFEWRGEESRDGGRSWSVSTTMRVERLKTRAPGVTG